MPYARDEVVETLWQLELGRRGISTGTAANTTTYVQTQQRQIDNELASSARRTAHVYQPPPSTPRVGTTDTLTPISVPDPKSTNDDFPILALIVLVLTLGCAWIGYARPDWVAALLALPSDWASHAYLSITQEIWPYLSGLAEYAHQRLILAHWPLIGDWVGHDNQGLALSIAMFGGGVLVLQGFVLFGRTRLGQFFLALLRSIIVLALLWGGLWIIDWLWGIQALYILVMAVGACLVLGTTVRLMLWFISSVVRLLVLCGLIGGTGYAAWLAGLMTGL